MFTAVAPSAARNAFAPESENRADVFITLHPAVKHQITELAKRFSFGTLTSLPNFSWRRHLTEPNQKPQGMWRYTYEEGVICFKEGETLEAYANVTALCSGPSHYRPADMQLLAPISAPLMTWAQEEDVCVRVLSFSPGVDQGLGIYHLERPCPNAQIKRFHFTEDGHALG